MGSANFGQPEAAAITALQALLGPARSKGPIAMAGNCTVDAAMQWSTITVYFLHGEFVGYATASLLGEQGANVLPDAATAAGLRVGDTLARAEQLYAGDIRTSYSQGGSWSVVTSNGTLAGYLTNEIKSTHPAPHIADVTAGSVGCPAASP